MRLAAALAIACALVVVPAAGADGVSYTIVSGTAGDNGWYRSPVKVQITASGAGTCASLTGVITFNSSSDVIDCTAGSATLHLQFNIDTTAPAVTGASADRAPDSNGWYTHPLTVNFEGTDSASGIASCTSASFTGPDSASGSVSGTCRDKAGNVSGAGSFAVRYDATPPVVTAAPGRAPTAKGWYNHPVTVKFSATDATSGLGACAAPVRYAGPDTATGTVTGTCSDQAGNQAVATFPLRYDTTPPRISDVVTSVAAAGVTLSWRNSGGTNATILRAPGRSGAKVSIVYRGPASKFHDTTAKKGVVYRYTVATTDAAGNDARVKVTTRMRLLYAPAAGALVRPGTALTWPSVSGATYYNVQLFRDGHKVLTAWPVTAHFKLLRTWKFGGRRATLARGTYKWYVWPGHGARAAARYGRLLGGSSFRVR